MNLRIMMRRLNKRNLWLLLLPFLLAACQSYKKVPYFQNVEVVNEVEQQNQRQSLCIILLLRLLEIILIR